MALLAGGGLLATAHPPFLQQIVDLRLQTSGAARLLLSLPTLRSIMQTKNMNSTKNRKYNTFTPFPSSLANRRTMELSLHHSLPSQNPATFLRSNVKSINLIVSPFPLSLFLPLLELQCRPQEHFPGVTNQRDA